MGRRLRHEAAPPWLPADQAIHGQPLHGIACGHPADTEFDAQLGIGRQSLARSQGQDALAQRLLDLAVLGPVAGFDHCARTGEGKLARSMASAP